VTLGSTAVDPVFVDRSGRRRRLIVTAGTVGGLVLLLAVVALLAGFTGTGSAAVPGWPGSHAGRATPRPTAAAPARSPRGHRGVAPAAVHAGRAPDRPT